MPTRSSTRSSKAGTSWERKRDDHLKELLIRGETLGPKFERKLATELSRVLLPEKIAQRVASWSNVTIVGTDLLGPIAFAWLPLGDEPYLGTRRAIDYLPSIPFGVRLAGQPAPAERAADLFLVVGSEPGAAVSKRWREAARLPFDEAARDRITYAFDHDRTAVLAGNNATVAALGALGPQNARILQFLGHAIHDPDRERSVGLVMAPGADDDGLVWCETVEQWAAPQLVFLASCFSGKGKTRRGDPSATDMSGAWLSRGARAVILGLGEIKYLDALSASETVHAQLVGGKSPAEALRVVRAALAEREGDNAPRLAPLLQVIGLGHEPVFD